MMPEERLEILNTTVYNILMFFLTVADSLRLEALNGTCYIKILIRAKTVGWLEK